MGDMEEIQLRKIVMDGVMEALKYTLRQDPTGAGLIFPLYNCKQVSKVFGVSVFTVRSWVRKGELNPRYQILSGRCFRLIFTTQDLLNFFQRNFPSKADLGHPCDPRSRKGAVVEKLLRMTNLYKRRRQPTG